MKLNKLVLDKKSVITLCFMYLPIQKCKQENFIWKGSLYEFFNIEIRSKLYLQFSQHDKKKKLPDAMERYNHYISSDSSLGKILNALDFLMLSNIFYYSGKQNSEYRHSIFWFYNQI